MLILIGQNHLINLSNTLYNRDTVKEIVNKTVFMISFSLFNQSLWCDPHWNRLSETISMSGNIIGLRWEIRKLAFWKLSILDLICCPVQLSAHLVSRMFCMLVLGRLEPVVSWSVDMASSPDMAWLSDWGSCTLATLAWSCTAPSSSCGNVCTVCCTVG